MKKGISLHIGLNYVDPEHYSGWDGKLNACEKDATDMEKIASNLGYETNLLLREQATVENVEDSITSISKKLNDGDIFYISYSGHGGQLPDINGDEADGIDETWCLFNGQLVDDKIKRLWSNFKKGVRIFVTSDSCHSGSIIKSISNNNITFSKFNPRFMPINLALTTYSNNKEHYDSILVSEKNKSKIEASIILISGCQDNQYSYDGTFNGTFTEALKRVWNGGKFKGNYKNFKNQILNLLPAYQSPNYLTLGNKNISFEKEKPFTI